VGQYSDFLQNLASTAGDTVVNKSVVVASVGIYEHDPVGLNGSLFQHQHDGGYVSYHHQHETSVVAGLVGAGFGVEPSPSTSPSVSPQHYIQHQQRAHQPDYTHNINSVDTCSGGGGGSQAMLMQGIEASPYTSSPSPVSPSVSSLLHLQRFQPQQQYSRTLWKSIPLRVSRAVRATTRKLQKKNRQGFFNLTEIIVPLF
jgi:hypothetical protein